LREPIEILSNGTIISGHKRLAALTLLGHKKVTVIVRLDLDDDPRAAHREFILSNLVRRHMSQLQITKCYLEMARLYPRGPIENDPDRTQIDYSVRLDEVLNCGPKNAERWKKAAGTPLEVQNALEQKQIRLVDAAIVSGLSKDVQDGIALAIREGRNAKAVLKEFLPKGTSKPPRPRLARLPASLAGRTE
jgi:hypothetical protein